MKRIELAERLRRSRDALGWVFPGQFHELVENLDAAIAYLDHGITETAKERGLRLTFYDCDHRWVGHGSCADCIAEEICAAETAAREHEREQCAEALEQLRADVEERYETERARGIAEAVDLIRALGDER